LTKKQLQTRQEQDQGMLLIDINTLFVVIVLIGILIAAILAIVGKGANTNLLFWAAGFGINSIAFALLAMRGLIPDLYSVWLANVMIATSFAFYAFGLMRFLNQFSNPLLVWGPVLIVAIGFSFLSENLAARILVMGLVNAYQSLLILTLLICNVSRLNGRGKFILAAAFAAGVVIALSRPFALAFDLLHITSVDSPGAFQNLTFLAILLINIAIALGLVLMQKEDAEAATFAMARTDDLTGLPNRRSLYEQISSVLVNSEKKRFYGALLLIDLDNFKAINDQHGHSIGDELLQQAAGRMLSCIDGNSSVARLGGDEFVVLLPDLAHDRVSATRVAVEKIALLRDRLYQDYLLGDDIIHHCPGSIGLAILDPGKTDRETLLREADQDMYRAKIVSKLEASRSSKH
jgi:diguanylate cyclase (GGDEF)-like protein